MASLSRSDLEGILALLRVGERFPDLASFERGILAELRHLLPCDTIGWNEVDAATGATWWLIDPLEAQPQADAQHDAFVEFVEQHPIVVHHTQPNDGSAVRLSDFVTQRGLHRLDIYQDFFHPLDIEYQTVITLPAPGTKLIGLPFNRMNGDFSERELSLLDTLRPHLVALHRHMLARDRMRQALERQPPDPQRAVLLLGGNDAVTYAGPHAELWLREAFGDPEQPGHLSDIVEDWLTTSRRAPPPGRPLTAHGVTVHYLRSTDHTLADALLVEHSAPSVDPAAASRLGLTTREREVLERAAAGQQNKEIAAALGISARTVQKHLAHVYDKVGVRTRAGAVARLRADAGAAADVRAVA